MDRPVTERDVVGKTIARILQTEWEHLETFSSCDFYIELTDGTLINLNDDSFSLIDADGRASLNLQDIDIDSDFPAYWTSDGYTGVGATIEKVLTASYDDIYLVLSGQYYLSAEIEEGQTALCLLDHNEFLHYARQSEFFDYWTKEPCIFNNMRAIDVIVESSVDDLDLWQSRELFLTIGRVKHGEVSDRLGVPNEANGKVWKARFVVPECGTYRIMVQRSGDDFVTDVHIDESVIAGGRLDIHVI